MNSIEKENSRKVDLGEVFHRLNVAGTGFCLAIIAGIIPAILSKDCHSNYLSSSFFPLIALSAFMFFMGTSPLVVTEILYVFFSSFTDAVCSLSRTSERIFELLNKTCLWLRRKKKELAKQDDTSMQKSASAVLFIVATAITFTVMNDVFSWNSVIKVHQIAKMQCDGLEGRQLPPDPRYPYQSSSD
ncbi:hypothetical protein [Azospirillum brasilense]|uniref:hypothetical protein n=1 Tax=Azospirillum brasilense TaxID=192 RepID=UPI0011ED0D43|nr:hypothetical protein [Azospirillum brasilense]